MQKLSTLMQERLDKWKKSLEPKQIPETSQKDSKPFNGKRDNGDVDSLDEWEREIQLSQTRRR
jgi:hypothetical protein